MPTLTYINPGKSFVRSTLLLLAVAGAGFIAGASWHNPISSRDVSVAFARPAQAAESDFRNPLPALSIVAAAGADEAGRSYAERISEPRECDPAQGISTACLFMD